MTQPPLQKPAPSLMGQTLSGSAYTVAASGVTVVLGLARSIILARLVAPEAFGVLAMALFFHGLRGSLTRFGINTALVRRQDADTGFERTAFACLMALELASLVLLLAALPLIQHAYPEMPDLRRVILVLVPAYVASFFAQVQEAHCRKKLAFRRLAQVDVISAIAMTATSLPAAWMGWGLGALVIEQVSGLVVRFLLLWGPLRAWQGGIAWDRVHMRWLWGFGRPTWIATNLGYLLDHFDDFWVGTSLGEAALGLYAKAYEFARYPRRVFANPLTSVLGPVFAAAQKDRLQLSQIFYRSAYFIWRTNLLIAGVAALAMPEFIRYVIGPQWLPMLLTFRLMMIYMVLDSLLLLINTLILHIGQSVHLQRAALIQAVVFVPGVIVGSRLWQQDGVALAADLMLLVGTCYLISPLRRVVDISLRRLLLWPTIVSGIGWVAAQAMGQALPIAPWYALAVKLGLFVVIFAVGDIWFERRDYRIAGKWLIEALRSRQRGAPISD